MAVELKYANSADGTGTLKDSTKGGKTFKAGQSVAIAAADDDGSVYGIAIVPGNAVFSRIDIQTTAITAGTDYELGFYEVGDGAPGAVADLDILMGTQTMASASVVLNGMAAVTADLRGQTVWELLSVAADPQKDYVLALTGNTVGTAAGTINVDFEFYTVG